MKHITNFLLIFFLIFNIQSWAKANDISEFHIEGISLGDSALKFFSENHIKKNSRDYYVDKEFTPVQNDLLDSFETYDAVDFNFKTGDKNYIIAALSGVLFYDDKPIKDCYKKMDEIINDLDNNYPNLDKSDKTTFKHPSPRNKSGKSIVTQIAYYFKNNDIIQVTCYDYSKEHGSQDHLNVSLQTYEFNDWLYRKAHNSTQ